MGYVNRYSIALQTSSGGAATGISSGNVNGRLLAVRYVPDGGASRLSSGATILLTGSLSGIRLMGFAPTSAARDIYPRVGLHSSVGTTLNWFDTPVAGNEEIRAVVSSGGAAKNGTLHLFVEGV